MGEHDKNSFENEADLFSNPDEDEYQFDDDNDQNGSTSNDKYRLEDDDRLGGDDDDDDDDEYETRSDGLLSKLENSVRGFMKMVTEEDPKKVLVPVAIGIVAFIVVIVGFVKFIGLFTANSDQKIVPNVDQPPAVTSPALTSPPVTEMLEPEVEQTSPERVVVAPNKQDGVLEEPPKMPKEGQELLQNTIAMQSAFEKRLSTLQSGYDATAQQINQLSQQTAQNSAQINNIARNVQMLESQVMKLNNVLLDLLKEAKQERSAVPQADQTYTMQSGMKTAVQVTNYYIQAIIPGRAWLKDANGKIFTVAIGDQIPDYGRVVNIDPKQGIVATDQGKMIEYGIEQF